MTDQPPDQPGADNAPDIPDDALEPEPEDGELGDEGAGPDPEAGETEDREGEE